jgi:hypothetical protein
MDETFSAMRTLSHRNGSNKIIYPINRPLYFVIIIIIIIIIILYLRCAVSVIGLVAVDITWTFEGNELRQFFERTQELTLII